MNAISRAESVKHLLGQLPQYRDAGFGDPIAEVGKLAPGRYRADKCNAEYLFCEFSFLIVTGGKTYNCSEFHFNFTKRHLTAKAHVWNFDLYFSYDFSCIDRGTCRNRMTGKIDQYGKEEGQLHYKKMAEASSPPATWNPSELPALYRHEFSILTMLFDASPELIVSEYSLTVLMDGKAYNSMRFNYNPSTRQVKARAHIWDFDFILAKDFKTIERGTYEDYSTGKILHYGDKIGQLPYTRVESDEGTYSTATYCV